MIEKIILHYKKYPITMFFITACVFVYCVSLLLFGFEMSVEDAISFGGYNPLFVDFYHQYYRLLTSQFIHFGLFHLAVNCYSLYGLGQFLETVLDRKVYLVVCVVSMLTTNGIPYIIYHINGFGVESLGGGISGMIFGLIGSLLVLALHYQGPFMQVFKQLATNILLMLMLSWIVPSISFSAHICGMIGGIAGTYIMIQTNDHILKWK